MQDDRRYGARDLVVGREERAELLGSDLPAEPAEGREEDELELGDTGPTALRKRSWKRPSLK